MKLCTVFIINVVFFVFISGIYPFWEGAKLEFNEYNARKITLVILVKAV